MINLKWIEGDSKDMKRAKEFLECNQEQHEIISRYCDVFRVILRYTIYKDYSSTMGKTGANVSMNEVIESLVEASEKDVLTMSEDYARQFSYKFAPYLIFDSDRQFSCHLVDAFKIVWSLMEIELSSHKETDISIGQNIELDSIGIIQRARNLISIEWEDTFINLKLDSAVYMNDLVDVDIEKRHWIESDKKANELEKMMYFALLRCGYNSSDRKSFERRISEINEINKTMTDYIWRENQKLIEMQQMFRITTLSQYRSSMITQNGIQLKILLEPKVIKYIMNHDFRYDRIDIDKHELELTVYEEDSSGSGVCGVYINREFMILSNNGLYNKVNPYAFE